MCVCVREELEMLQNKVTVLTRYIYIYIYIYVCVCVLQLLNKKVFLEGVTVYEQLLPAIANTK
jgi:hypothetical protein